MLAAHSSLAVASKRFSSIKQAACARRICARSYEFSSKFNHQSADSLNAVMEVQRDFF